MFLREPSHILILVIVLVVLFGAKKLPDSAKSIAKSLKVFRDEMKNINYFLEFAHIWQKLLINKILLLKEDIVFKKSKFR